MPDKAVIWDMDGVIVDSGRYHFKSWQYAFAKRGINFTETDFKRIFGQRNDAIINRILGKASAKDIQEIAGDKENCFRDLIKDNIEAFPGVVQLIKTLPDNGFKMAIASSAPLENIEIILGGLRVHNYFEAIVTGREVTESKPSPQIFLLAAEKLKVPPGKSIVVEDAVAGVQAAKRAGMHCIAVTNTNSREALGEADLVIDSLEQVSVSSLEKLLIS